MVRKSLTLLIFPCLPLMPACGEGDAAALAPRTSVSFENQSQFTVEALYLHESPLNYPGQQNLLQNPLQPGQSIQDEIPAINWYVTVLRKPNQDSAVLAYTTAKAWDPAEYPKIIYFDEQFRVSKE